LASRRCRALGLLLVLHPDKGRPVSVAVRRVPASFAMFSALMAGTRLRGDHTCRRVVPGWVWEQGEGIGGLRRAGALRRAGFRGHWESVAVSCDRDTDPSHIGCVIRQAPTAHRAITRRNGRPWARSWMPRTGVGAPSRDGYRRAPLPGSHRAVGRVGVDIPRPAAGCPAVMHGAPAGHRRPGEHPLARLRGAAAAGGCRCRRRRPVFRLPRQPRGLGAGARTAPGTRTVTPSAGGLCSDAA